MKNMLFELLHKNAMMQQSVVYGWIMIAKLMLPKS